MSEAPRVVLYTKQGCSLCDDAAGLLDRLAIPYESAEDPRYAERVPVIEIDGTVVAELRVSERVVRRALRQARRQASKRA